MQSVAAEMKHSETAFVQPRADGDFDLRWFTPEVEVDLCGHATLASAHVLWEAGRLAPTTPRRFHTRGGELRGHAPADGAVAARLPHRAARAVRRTRRPARRARHREGRVARAPTGAVLHARRAPTPRPCASSTPDFTALRALARRARRLRDRGRRRRRARHRVALLRAAVGIDEDAVTGSMHCVLAPYWCERLGRPRSSRTRHPRAAARCTPASPATAPCSPATRSPCCAARSSPSALPATGRRVARHRHQTARSTARRSRCRGDHVTCTTSRRRRVHR